MPDTATQKYENIFDKKLHENSGSWFITVKPLVPTTCVFSLHYEHKNISIIFYIHCF